MRDYPTLYGQTHIKTKEQRFYCHSSFQSHSRLLDQNQETFISTNLNSYTHYVHIVLVQLFVSCRVSFVNRITTRRIVSSSDAVYTNSCTSTFMHITHLSNIFIKQKRAILFDFIIIFIFNK